MSINLIVATGNIGKDAEQRFTQGGDSIVSFSLPVKSGFGDKAKTSWVKCTIFGKRGEGVLPYLKKGALVGVSGEFSMNEWTNREGQKVSTPECRVAELTLLGSKSSASNEEYAKPAPKADQRNVQGAQGGAIFDVDDGIPFSYHGANGAWRVM